MSVITFAALLLFGLLDLISVLTEIFRRRTVGSNEAKESSVAHRRRVLLHLAAWVLIIGGFWAIVHFGPLRPVHEWLR
jgi:predicted MFS family arabinose efflux permease